MQQQQQQQQQHHLVCPVDVGLDATYQLSPDEMAFVSACAKRRARTDCPADVFVDTVGLAGEVAFYRLLGATGPLEEHMFVHEEGNTARRDVGDIVLTNGESIDVKTTTAFMPEFLHVKLNKLQYLHSYYVLMRYVHTRGLCVFLGAVRGEYVALLPFSPSTNPTDKIGRISFPRCFLQAFSSVMGPPPDLPLTAAQWKRWFATVTTTFNDIPSTHWARPLVENAAVRDDLLFRMRHDFGDAVSSSMVSSSGRMPIGSRKRRWFRVRDGDSDEEDEGIPTS